MDTCIPFPARTGAVLRTLLAVVAMILLSPHAAPAQFLDRSQLIERALRLCHQIPDDDCRGTGSETPGLAPSPEVQARRLRASTKADLLLQLIPLEWLAGQQVEARAEAARLISQNRAQKCRDDADGERMRQRLIDVLRASGTTAFHVEIVKRRARENPDYGVRGPAAGETFSELVASSSLDAAMEFLVPLPDSTQLKVAARSLLDLPGRAPLDSVVALQHRLPTGSVGPFEYNNLAILAARRGRLDIARAAVDAMPDASDSKADVLALVAQECARAGRTAEALRLVDRAFELDGQRKPGDRWFLDINGYSHAGAALVLAGATDELARRRPSIPAAAWRQILMVRASAEAAAGHIEDALADLKEAQTLPVWFHFSDNPIDEGLVEWIGAEADSGRDTTAARALDCLHSRTLREGGWSRIAQARARRGEVTGATAAADSITHSAYALAEAVPAITVAQAATGGLDHSVATLEAASARLTAMCRLPNDGPLGICPHGPECPPVSMIFEMRRQALRGLGATIRTQAELDRLLAGREPVEQATVLLGVLEATARQ